MRTLNTGDLKEVPLSISGREFVLREMTMSRTYKLEELGELSTELGANLAALAPEKTKERKSIRTSIRDIDLQMYRILLIPVAPTEPPSDQWLRENIGAGLLDKVIMPAQQKLNNHEDVLGNE